MVAIKCTNSRRRLSACTTKLHLHGLYRDGVAVRLADEGHHLAETVRRDFILIRNLENLPVFSHQDNLVAVPNAPCDALGIVPHTFAFFGARLIDDISGQSSGHRTGGHCGPTAAAASSAAARRL